jgi:hypothetical protein
MKKSWDDMFIDTLYEKYPRKADVVKNIQKVLLTGVEPIYRRLRKDIKFSAEELMEIASKLDVSLDEIIGKRHKEHIFKTTFIDYVNPSKEQLIYVKRMSDLLDFAKDKSGTEYIEISNELPRSIISFCPDLIKYRMLTLLYKYATGTGTLSFSNIQINKKLFEIISDIHEKIKNIKTTTYIWDNMLFTSIANNVHYFNSINLISNEEKQLIKNDALKLLDYLYEIAEKGTWIDTPNKVKLYISHTYIDSYYSYFCADQYKICRVHSFADSRLHTQDPIIIEKFEKFLALRKKGSMLISSSDEKNRMDFFTKQRKVIEAM